MCVIYVYYSPKLLYYSIAYWLIFTYLIESFSYFLLKIFINISIFHKSFYFTLKMLGSFYWNSFVWYSFHMIWWNWSIETSSLLTFEIMNRFCCWCLWWRFYVFLCRYFFLVINIFTFHSLTSHANWWVLVLWWS